MLFLSRLALMAALILGAQSAAAQQAQPAAQGVMKIDVVTLTLMIKGAVTALHQANVTGNYSVLRDLGTPVFREQFDQTALAGVFANLRARKINLSPALLLAPNLTKNPELNKNNELVLVGDFPTQPLRIHFELAFVQLDGAWRIAGIAVDAVPPPATQASAAAAAAAKPAEAPKPAKTPANAQTKAVPKPQH
ncbi:MAG: hypothetical protein HY765_02520 [Rhodomicrobium sp.]|nr:hypothetical protein [Rhodomicrobium sp.]